MSFNINHTNKLRNSVNQESFSGEESFQIHEDIKNYKKKWENESRRGNIFELHEPPRTQIRKSMVRRGLLQFQTNSPSDIPSTKFQSSTPMPSKNNNLLNNNNNQFTSDTSLNLSPITVDNCNDKSKFDNNNCGNKLEQFVYPKNKRKIPEKKIERNRKNSKDSDASETLNSNAINIKNRLRNSKLIADNSKVETNVDNTILENDTLASCFDHIIQDITNIKKNVLQHESTKKMMETKSKIGKLMDVIAHLKNKSLNNESNVQNEKQTDNKSILKEINENNLIQNYNKKTKLNGTQNLSNSSKKKLEKQSKINSVRTELESVNSLIENISKQNNPTEKENVQNSVRDIELETAHSRIENISNSLKQKKNEEKQRKGNSSRDIETELETAHSRIENVSNCLKQKKSQEKQSKMNLTNLIENVPTSSKKQINSKKKLEKQSKVNSTMDIQVELETVENILSSGKKQINCKKKQQNKINSFKDIQAELETVASSKKVNKTKPIQPKRKSDKQIKINSISEIRGELENDKQNNTNVEVRPEIHSKAILENWNKKYGIYESSNDCASVISSAASTSSDVSSLDKQLQKVQSERHTSGELVDKYNLYDGIALNSLSDVLASDGSESIASDFSITTLWQERNQLKNKGPWRFDGNLPAWLEVCQKYNNTMSNKNSCRTSDKAILPDTHLPNQSKDSPLCNRLRKEIANSEHNAIENDESFLDNQLSKINEKEVGNSEETEIQNINNGENDPNLPLIPNESRESEKTIENIVPELVVRNEIRNSIVLLEPMDVNEISNKSIPNQEFVSPFPKTTKEPVTKVKLRKTRAKGSTRTKSNLNLRSRKIAPTLESVPAEEEPVIESVPIIIDENPVNEEENVVVSSNTELPEKRRRRKRTQSFLTNDLVQNDNVEGLRKSSRKRRPPPPKPYSGFYIEDSRKSKVVKKRQPRKNSLNHSFSNQVENSVNSSQVTVTASKDIDNLESGVFDVTYEVSGVCAGKFKLNPKNKKVVEKLNGPLFCMVVEGEAEILVDNVKERAKKFDGFTIPSGACSSIENLSCKPLILSFTKWNSSEIS